MASRHSTGVTYSLARNSCFSTSMRLECAICGRGAEFFHGPQCDAAWLFLTVFIALTGFPHGVFPLRPDVRDSPTAPPVDGKPPRQLALSWATADLRGCSIPGLFPHGVWHLRPHVNGLFAKHIAEFSDISLRKESRPCPGSNPGPLSPWAVTLTTTP